MGRQHSSAQATRKARAGGSKRMANARAWAGDAPSRFRARP
eukprot:CAMPEP_0176312936 /NCGR_PEP_ID=MMETSP0121_2-20121125/66920_1 /TAXON_ID=160619 /ORGANISM="Kryptoperidinium foliaceum, Strain CCMP 1326" /LENGTH=40 /DNA_ID= /DNA_START= /DNA_END= /DNA_ORIENTATION=